MRAGQPSNRCVKHGARARLPAQARRRYTRWWQTPGRYFRARSGAQIASQARRVRRGLTVDLSAARADDVPMHTNKHRCPSTASSHRTLRFAHNLSRWHTDLFDFRTYGFNARDFIAAAILLYKES